MSKINEITVPLGAKYRVKSYLILFAILFFTLFVILIAEDYFRQLKPESHYSIWSMLGESCMALVGIYLLINSQISSIYFTHDAIVQKGVFNKTKIALNNIRRRYEADEDGSDGKLHFYFIESCDRSDSTIKFQEVYDFDEEFWYWYYSLPE